MKALIEGAPVHLHAEHPGQRFAGAKGQEEVSGNEHSEDQRQMEEWRCQREPLVFDTKGMFGL